MKNLLLSAFLGLAALTVTPALSQAGTFGLFTGCGCCSCSSCCTFCVRPYNAFTPVCSGNITCMGCMPFACQPPAYAPPPYGAPGYDAPSYGEGGCCSDAPQASGNSVGDNQTLPPLPPRFGQPEPLPNPMLAPGTTTPATSRKISNPSGAVQAGYRPVYAPTYNPYQYYNYYAPMGQTPYYWNAK